MTINAAISGERNVINEGAEKFLKYKDLNNSACGIKNKSDPSNNRGNLTVR